MRLTQQARDELKRRVCAVKGHSWCAADIFDGLDQLDALIADSEELDRVTKERDTLSEIVAALRRALADPTPDVQELVLTKLGIREQVARLAQERDALSEELETKKVIMAEMDRGNDMLLDLLAEALPSRPAVIAEGILALTAQRDAWRADAERLYNHAVYSEHSPSCRQQYSSNPCICGLDQALESHNQMTK